ncbi:TPA: hypothetical protein RSW71_003307 [Vibrio cholerae]|nr:hypothetical protein [Vibrio cholerae]
MVAVVVLEFSGMRCQPLRRALCLITQNQWFMVFLCPLGWLVLSLSASWLQWALFSGHLFFVAENSENCLNQFSGKREVGAAGSIRNLILGFLSFSSQISKSDFQNYESFRFSTFWLLFVNQS